MTDTKKNFLKKQLDLIIEEFSKLPLDLEYYEKSVMVKIELQHIYNLIESSDDVLLKREVINPLQNILDNAPKQKFMNNII